MHQLSRAGAEQGLTSWVLTTLSPLSIPQRPHTTTQMKHTHIQIFPLHSTACWPALCQHSNTSLHCSGGTGTKDLWHRAPRLLYRLAEPPRQTRPSSRLQQLCKFTSKRVAVCCVGNVLSLERDQTPSLSVHELYLKGGTRDSALPPHCQTPSKKYFCSSSVGNISSCRVAPKVNCGQNWANGSGFEHHKLDSNQQSGSKVLMSTSKAPRSAGTNGFILHLLSATHKGSFTNHLEVEFSWSHITSRHY